MILNNPKLLVIAGPNGSGKSTISQGLPLIGLYINADDIKRRRGGADLEAAQEAEALRELCVAQRVDFSFETVLSTERNLQLLTKAKDQGYFIECVFVLTVDAELNVFRVINRVAKGGHSVPSDKIRSRYAKSLANLPALLALCDKGTVVDNTKMPLIIFRKDAAGEFIYEHDFWPRARILKLIMPDG